MAYIKTISPGKATRVAKLIGGTAPNPEPLELGMLELARKAHHTPKCLTSSELDPLRTLVDASSPATRSQAITFDLSEML